MGLSTEASVMEQTPVYISDAQDLIIDTTQGWGVLGIDKAAHPGGEDAMPLQIANKQYAKGLGSHANGEIVVDLAGRYRTFEAEIGVQQQPSRQGSVIFKVLADDREIFSSGEMLGTTPAQHIKLEVAGVDELTLVATDAGNDITCDMANWAEARLTPDPAPKPRTKEDEIDIARFARVLSWDPSRMDGARTSRCEEFPAEDLYLESDVIPESDGAYQVPKAADGRGCIGLQWLQRRRIRELGIRFTDISTMKSMDGVETQYWVMPKRGPTPGGSVWQGRWEKLNGAWEQRGGDWVYVIDWKNAEDRRSGTLKIRWIFPASDKAIAIRQFSATPESRWKTVDLLLQSENASPDAKGSIEIYNGEIIGNGDSIHTDWQMVKPLNLKVKYCTTTRWLTDRTVLRLKLPSGAFGVAVDDVINNGCVYVKDFDLFAADAFGEITLQEYRKKIANQKTVLERVREMPDQTFQQALEQVHRAAADLGPTMLSLACGNRKYIVSRDGLIEWDKDPAAYNCFEHPLPKAYSCRMNPEFGTQTAESITRHLQGDWLPIIVTDSKSGGIIYRQRTFVAPADYDAKSTESPMLTCRKPLCTAEFTMTNPLSEPANVSLKITLISDQEKGEQAQVREIPGGAVAEDNGKMLAFIHSSNAGPLKSEIKDGVWTISGKLPAGAEAKCAVYIPGWDATAGEISSINAEKLADNTEAYWRRVMEPAVKIEIPDKFLQNIILASQVHCMLAARNEDYKNVAEWASSWYYGPLESESESPIRGMEFLGNLDFARRCHDYFIKRYSKEGFLTTGYTLMGTGWHLWCAGEYYQLSKDQEWLKTNADEIAKACKWVMAQREKTKKTDAFGRKVPEWGLMPPGPMADWEAFSFYFYLNGYYYAGLNAMGHALVDIGYPEAKNIVSSADELRECIMNAFHSVQSLAPVYPLQDGTWVPAYPTHAYCPAPIDNFYKGEDVGRSWAYDVELGAHHLIPQGVMDPKSKDARWMIDHMEDVQFLADGWLYGGYSSGNNHKDWFNLGGFAKVQPYYARTGEVHALQDDIKAFIRTYFNSIVCLLNREDLSLWEHFFNGAYNKTHETGYFLYQSRTMLLTERGDQLWLAPFVTNNWLKDGMNVAVTNAPTMWGAVSYRIQSHVSKGYMEVYVTPPAREIPKEIVIRLRHPEGKRIKSVEVNGRRHDAFNASKDTVTIKPVDRKAVMVRVEFNGE